jgi:hypothetical protein
MFWLSDGYALPHATERLRPTGAIELVINVSEDLVRVLNPSVSLTLETEHINHVPLVD